MRREEEGVEGWERDGRKNLTHTENADNTNTKTRKFNTRTRE